VFLPSQNLKVSRGTVDGVDMEVMDGMVASAVMPTLML
jgi:hypothetical protein